MYETARKLSRMRLVQKKGSKTKHEDGLVAAFLVRSMWLVIHSAALFDSF